MVRRGDPTPLRVVFLRKLGVTPKAIPLESASTGHWQPPVPTTLAPGVRAAANQPMFPPASPQIMFSVGAL